MGRLVIDTFDITAVQLVHWNQAGEQLNLGEDPATETGEQLNQAGEQLNLAEDPATETGDQAEQLNQEPTTGLADHSTEK